MYIYADCLSSTFKLFYLYKKFVNFLDKNVYPYKMLL